MDRSAWLALVLAFSTGLGCAGIANVQPEFELPPQDLSQQAPEGHCAVVFFNDSNWLMFGLDGSGKLNVFLEETPLASLNIGDYVQVMLPEGERFVTLSHEDLGTMISTHTFVAEGDRVFVRVYATITSNGLQVVEAPPDFPSDFEPALDPSTEPPSYR